MNKFMKRFCAITSVLLLASALVSCGAGTEAFPDAGRQTDKRGAARKGQTFRYAGMGRVPFFIDDSGSWLQEADGYLYGSADGKIFRYDKETLEKEVLFEAHTDHIFDFCIDDGYVYFTDRPRTSSLTDRDTLLYRMKCDGTELTILADDIPNANASEHSFATYCPRVFDDIIYLTYYNEQRFYRLSDSGDGLQELSIEDTVYGKLPTGNTYAIYPLEYCLKNYGYAFTWNIDKNLQQILFAGEGVEKQRQIGLPARDGYVLTNDALYCADREGNKWYRVWLDDMDCPEVFLETEISDYGMTSWDETGIYFLDMEYSADGNRIDVKKADREGRLETLLSGYDIGSYCYWKNRVFIVDSYLYYYESADAALRLVRVPLFGEKQPEVVDICALEESAAVSYQETEEWTVEIEENAYFDIDFTKLFLNGDTEAEENINDYLKKIYKEVDKLIEEDTEFVISWNEELRESGMEDFFHSYLSIRAAVSYIDEKYIGIYVAYEDYFYPGAHGMHWSDEYVFDRETGERISITDIVNNTEEEICGIVNAYIKKDRGWGLDEYEWMEEESILEQDRFFLTGEGIGIHYDVYEIGCYAEGDVDYIIPFDEFDMK